MSIGGLLKVLLPDKFHKSEVSPLVTPIGVVFWYASINTSAILQLYEETALDEANTEESKENWKELGSLILSWATDLTMT